MSARTYSVGTTMTSSVPISTKNSCGPSGLLARLPTLMSDRPKAHRAGPMSEATYVAIATAMNARSATVSGDAATIRAYAHARPIRSGFKKLSSAQSARSSAHVPRLLRVPPTHRRADRRDEVVDVDPHRWNGVSCERRTTSCRCCRC